MYFVDKSPDEFITYVANVYPEIRDLLEVANSLVTKYKGSMQPYQAACLYYTCKQSEFEKILEIGTGVGYSTFFIAKACPDAKIVTLNPNLLETEHAKRFLNDYCDLKNITFSEKMSWNYYGLGNKTFDMVYVDGNHKQVTRDFQWWNNINPNGLMLFHDYSEIEQPYVWNELNKFCGEIDRKDFDVLMIDNKRKLGMAGFYK